LLRVYRPVYCPGAPGVLVFLAFYYLTSSLIHMLRKDCDEGKVAVLLIEI
jgi:hypothetical protein